MTDSIDSVENLKPYQTVRIKSDGGPEFEITRLNGGTYVHREGDSNSAFVPRSGEFKFIEREQKRRDALDEFDDMDRGV